MNNDNFNDFVKKQIINANNISNLYNYPSNITHLLYLIIPAFILKYGLEQERYIINAFTKIPIIISDKEDNIYQAYYQSIPIKKDNSYEIYKCIVLRNYKNISLMQLLDNLVHEFNHAINSIYQESKEIEDKIYLRTGLTYIIYNRNTLKQVKKDESYILEEIINTKQTEIIIDIINSFNKYSINDITVTNTLYAINHSITNSFKSNAYLLQSLVCKTLIENKTFFSTLENLRLKGNVDELDSWFDNITGDLGSYKKLISILNDVMKYQIKLNENKKFNYFTIRKIKKLNISAIEIINKFDANCNYR